MPLPKSAQGLEYVFIIVDYATLYPEIVPLRKATSWNMSTELVLLFCTVGTLKKLLTIQGTPFVSRLISNLCQLLQVKHLRTSVCHPQTDSLVEIFNETLKRVVDKEGRNLELPLFFVLFTI